MPLDAGDEVLPSALDTLDAAHQETPASPLSLDELVPDWTDRQRQRLRHQVFVKPVLGGTYLPGEGASLRVGAAAGHRFWTMKPSLVSFGGEERLAATGMIGAGSGGGVHASAVFGPWIGPVGLRAGPTLRTDRTVWSDEVELSGATSIGVLVDVTALFGKLALTAGMEPGWFVTGDRPSAPTLGDEASVRAGFGWIGTPVQWTIDGEARSTSVGTVYSGGVALHLRFL